MACPVLACYPAPGGTPMEGTLTRRDLLLGGTGTMLLAGVPPSDVLATEHEHEPAAGGGGPSGLRAVAALAAQDAKRLAQLLGPCIDVCADCEKECRKHADKHAICKACAQACERVIAEAKKLKAA
jgi:hypothetical protein